MPIRATGMEELQRKLHRLRKLNTDTRIAEKALKAGAIPIRDEMERLAPESTFNKEHLAENILIGEIIDGRIRISYHKDFFYGKFLEWGTSKMEKQPWMEVAYLNVKHKALEAMAHVYQTELRKIL
ncbi:HK97-gp10 family putative phage morphogenesis protein [Priestia megaterium]|uniref:HK97-gp10 family putative phage morphogenesis protein n=1 Tax=Priestia megaterium TaxID=1404 RepID=UPI00300B99AD